MDVTILINREHKLDENFIPTNLIVTDKNENNFHGFIDPNMKPMIEKNVFSYFKKMQEEALKNNINIIIDSGYRSYDYQQTVWNYYVEKYGLEETKKRVAPPGASEHQSGLAFDVGYIINNEFVEDINDEQTETKWLFANSYKYGFILRYPKGKEDITGYSYEPWHYRFVGIELASHLYENNITLEEYYLEKEPKKN